MDHKLDERTAAARSQVHDCSQRLARAHADFITASDAYDKALATYRDANRALCEDDKKAIDRVADAFELAKASDSTARLKAQTNL